MKIPPFLYRVIQPHRDVPLTLHERGFVYTLHRARVIDRLFVQATFKLRCHP